MTDDTTVSLGIVIECGGRNFALLKSGDVLENDGLIGPFRLGEVLESFIVNLNSVLHKFDLGLSISEQDFSHLTGIPDSITRADICIDRLRVPLLIENTPEELGNVEIDVSFSWENSNEIWGIEFKSLTIGFQKPVGDNSNSSSKITFTIESKVEGVDVTLCLNISEGRPEISLKIKDLTLILKGISNGFIATYTDRNSIRFKLIDLLSSELADELPSELQQLEIQPKSALVAYFKATANTPSKFLLGLELGLDLPSLTNLPLLGDKLSADKALKIETFQFLAASEAINGAEIQQLRENQSNGQKNFLQPDLHEIAAGVILASSLQFGGERHPLTLPLFQRSPRSPKPEKSADPDQPSAPVAPSSAPVKPKFEVDQSAGAPILWYNIQKKLGPVTFNRIGAQYRDRLVWFLLDVTLSISELTLTLNGLAVGFDVLRAIKEVPNKKFDALIPRFRLDGVGIEYRGSDAFEVGGAFLREQITINGQTIDQYSGAALIKTKTFTISAIGSYAELNGHPSIFVYAFLDKPIGGPAFFFVTGLALGFGYNRALISPTTVEAIESFPLVQMAMGRSNPLVSTNNQAGLLMNVLKSLGNSIYPAPGKMFVAVGIKFNSFKLIDSFALLIVTFGDRVRMKLLGISKLVAPVPDSGTTPVAEVTIGIIAEFIPDEGVLRVDGKIMPGSYVFSRDCHLSGGFAFYAWFDGIHEGDFVLTVGGYHPKFNVPAHYPKVDRLVLNWQVDPHLTIKGDAYFALTPSAVMAGGHLDARLDKGDLKAWFSIGADFLISWQPYYYDISVYASIGASYRTFLKTFSISLAADLHIWGPEFTGRARIKWSIISFDVAFGATGTQRPKALEWSEFKAKFLPKDADVCTISVKSGLIASLEEGQSTRWVINPTDLALTINSVIPITKAVKFSCQNISPANPDLGIGSMELQTFDSTQTIEIKRGNDHAETDFEIIPILKNVPSALWGKKRDPDLNGTPIPNALCGFEIRPVRQSNPAETRDIPCSNLSYNPDSASGTCNWEKRPTLIPAQQDEEDHANEIKETLQKGKDFYSLKGLMNFDSDDLNQEQDPFDSDPANQLVDEFLDIPRIMSLTLSN